MTSDCYVFHFHGRNVDGALIREGLTTHMTNNHLEEKITKGVKDEKRNTISTNLKTTGLKF